MRWLAVGLVLVLLGGCLGQPAPSSRGSVPDGPYPMADPARPFRSHNTEGLIVNSTLPRYVPPSLDANGTRLIIWDGNEPVVVPWNGSWVAFRPLIDVSTVPPLWTSSGLPPRATILAAGSEAVVGQAVSFVGDAQDPDGGAIQGWLWDFGDGTPNAVGRQVSHAYATAGTYNVRLDVRDIEGRVGTATFTLLVLATPAPASFTLGPALYVGIFSGFSRFGVGPGDLVTFTAYRVSEANATYHWDFGDGTNATGQEVGHAYALVGNYTAVLTVTTPDGRTAQATRLVDVRLDPPILTVWVTPLLGSLHLRMDAADYDGRIVSATWTLADGSMRDGTRLELTQTGPTRVTATVVDDDGLSASVTKDVTVPASPPTVMSLHVAPPETAMERRFSAFASDGDGTVVSYLWDFGDGTVVAGGTSMSHSYAAPGDYTVTVTATDDEGDSASRSLGISL